LFQEEPGLYELTDIHTEIIFLIKDGKQFKEIESIMIGRLGITSVGNHVKKIYVLLNKKRPLTVDIVNSISGIYKRLEMFNQ
jgi:hypothetical protein